MPKIVAIPPEEFYINEGTTSINDDPLTRFAAHWYEVPLSDIKEMFDVEDDELYGFLGGTDTTYEYEKAVRHAFDDTYDHEGYESGLREMRNCRLMECWIRADRDGDGIAEWRHCFAVANTLLFDEEWFCLLYTSPSPRDS